MSTTELRSQIPLPLDAIAALCRRHGVERLDVFGSVLREDFRPESDVDFLVVFLNNDYGPWLNKNMELQDDLERLLGRTVDLVDRQGVEKSPNYIRRRHILSTAIPIYVQG